ncbi:MAG: hypothetical protein AW12_03113 [Candidatus Accumulibacter sp. BA-94]|nr:MAG: hypothetical protein AW12_03113 [Candidatus Accumulibacter sp. BA-94]
MPRQKGHVVAERPQALANRRDQGVEIAFREVGATDGSLEQHVADDRQTVRPAEEDDMSGRMPRAMKDVHLDLAEMHRIAVLEPAIRGESAHFREAEHPALRRHAVDPELIFALRPFDRQG